MQQKQKKRQIRSVTAAAQIGFLTSSTARAILEKEDEKYPIRLPRRVFHADPFFRMPPRRIS
jgi:hypothetical protein